LADALCKHPQRSALVRARYATKNRAREPLRDLRGSCRILPLFDPPFLADLATS
jgi:hypothetical protein